jgi:hypothetical protein
LPGSLGVAAPKIRSIGCSWLCRQP